VRLKQYEACIDGIAEAICAAWRHWQSLATLSGVVINGPVAAGAAASGLAAMKPGGFP
jgi:hypothetical protein